MRYHFTAKASCQGFSLPTILVLLGVMGLTIWYTTLRVNQLQSMAKHYQRVEAPSDPFEDWFFGKMDCTDLIGYNFHDTFPAGSLVYVFPKINPYGAVATYYKHTFDDAIVKNPYSNVTYPDGKTRKTRVRYNTKMGAAGDYHFKFTLENRENLQNPWKKKFSFVCPCLPPKDRCLVQ